MTAAAIVCRRCDWTAGADVTDADRDQNRRDLVTAAWAHARVSGHTDSLDLVIPGTGQDGAA